MTEHSRMVRPVELLHACTHTDLQAYQHNAGTPRSLDFDAMLLRHPGEQGVAIDHWAALVTEGDNYRVFTVQGDSGSLMPDGSLTADGAGLPAIWTKEVVDQVVKTTLAPKEGKLADLLRPATDITQDPRADLVRKANPE